MRTLITNIFCCLVALFPAIHAQAIERPQSENYIHGVEALNEGNAEKAYHLLNAEINEHPDNGYAHCYMALVCSYYGDLKLAMHAANTCMELIPEEDAEYHSFAHYTRGTLYMHTQAYDLAKRIWTRLYAWLPRMWKTIRPARRF